MNYDQHAESVLEAAEKEKDEILQRKDKPIVSIDVLAGHSDCFVECLRHGIKFYQDSQLTTSSDQNNHRGNTENIDDEGQLYLLQENNSGKFRYTWNQKLLKYEFERLEEVLDDGQIY